jgi:hypothetical protein
MRITQSKLADWTLMCGLSSFILPIFAMLVLAGAVSMTAFWLKCAGLFALAVSSFWMLSRSVKGQFGYPAISWLASLVYFISVLSALTAVSEAPAIVGILCIPEIAGLVLCLVGLGHVIYVRRKNA